MKNKALRERLLLACEFVKPDTAAADIGTDHAALAIELIKSGRCSRVLACDINSGPLESAKKNIAAACCCEQIETRLSNGLCSVLPEEADEIIIAGMGGLLITEIITGAPWLQSSEKGLVLQPMSDAHILRQYLYENGFEIERERAVYDNKRLYSVLRAVYNGEKHKRSDFEYHTGALTSNPGKNELDYIKREMLRTKKRLDGQRINPDDPQEIPLLLSLYNELSRYLEGKI